MQYYQCEKYPIEFVVSENIDKHFGSHTHTGHYIISMVLQGAVTVNMEGREWTCREGDVFIVRPHVVHSVHQGGETHLLSMCIGTSFVEETDFKVAEDIVQSLLEDAARQRMFGIDRKEKLSSSVQAVLRFGKKGKKEMDAVIKTIADQMSSHPEQEKPVERLAADIFVSKYYFIRKFKSSTGMTPHQFRIQNRIRKAQRLLDGEKTIGGIAAEMGFYDQSHFDRAFRKIVGISPAEYAVSKRVLGQST